MAENPVEVTISLSDSYLNDEELQEVVQSLLTELSQVEGVYETDLIPLENAPTGAKSLGGFLLGKLKAFVNLKNLKTVISWLQKNLPGKTIEIKAKGKGKEIEIKINSPEDLEKIMPTINDFINS